MVDWSGLYNWSMKYNDGTRPSEFKPMSKEDRVWLEEAMKQYTFNDVDRLQQVVTQLKEDMAKPEKERMASEELISRLEELIDLVELHPRNNLNLCLSGGMQIVLALIFGNENPLIRQKASSVFQAVCLNNKPVQDFALKSGATNLVV